MEETRVRTRVSLGGKSDDKTSCIDVKNGVNSRDLSVVHEILDATVKSVTTDVVRVLDLDI